MVFVCLFVCFCFFVLFCFVLFFVLFFVFFCFLFFCCFFLFFFHMVEVKEHSAHYGHVWLNIIYGSFLDKLLLVLAPFFILFSHNDFVLFCLFVASHKIMKKAILFHRSSIQNVKCEYHLRSSLILFPSALSCQQATFNPEEFTCPFHPFCPAASF